MVVGDVPVIMQRQFQQSLCCMSEVPQIQFIDRVLRAVAQQRQDFTVQTVQKTAEIPQVRVQFLEVVDVPVVVQRQAGVDVAITAVGGVEGFFGRF